MIPLLRYAIVKGMRDNSLLPILLGPVVMITSPILGVGIVEAIRGHGGFPFRFVKGSLSPQITVVTTVAAAMAILAAGVAAFLVYRTEIMNRSIGFFVLARRPVEIAAAAAIEGTFVGVISLLACVPAVLLLMGGVADRLVFILAMVAVGSLVSAGAGILLAAISCDTGMIIPLAVVAFATAIFVLDSSGPMRPAATAGVALVLILAASFLLEKKCAG